MKNLKFSFVFFIFAGFIVFGCSDKSQAPVEPADTHSLLEKTVITNFTFTDFPIAEPTGGSIQLTPGGKWQVKKLVVLEKFASTDPLADGIMENNLSITIDAVTGEGPCHGSWVITPSNLTITGGGVWEGTYHGYRSKSDVAGEWILPFKVEGHGKGGTIDGMQVFATGVLIVRADGPTTLPTSWVGTGEGFYKSH